MRTISSQNDIIRVTCFDAEVWKQERNIINVTIRGAISPNHVDLYNGETMIARYYGDSNAQVTIDVTDYLRVNPTLTSLVLKCDTETLTITFSVVGLVNPANLVIPVSKWYLFPILPPTMLLKDIGTKTIFEASGEFDQQINYSFNNTQETLGRGNELPVGTTSFKICENVDPVVQYTMRPIVCGREYVAVKWVSRTGVQRCHTFEVRGRKTSVDESVELMTQDNSFHAIKGFVESFNLFLEGLNSYDFWYYSDLIFSSDVQVSFDGSTWTRVGVTTSSSDLLDGDAELKNLEIAVNYKRYDATPM